MPSFRIDQQPWIPVETLDGHFRELSLAEVLADVLRIRRLVGTPPEAAVLHRFLLAILHRAVPVPDLASWQKLWREPAIAFDAARAYVGSHADAFDLFDSRRPFLQHPALPPGDKPMAVLLYDRARGNNPVFLDASLESDMTPCTPAEAIRGMLVNFAFGGSHPDKSNPLSTGKENTMYAGPLCARLIAVVEGENLAETLLLNLLVGQEAGRPAWERPVPPHPCRTPAEGLCDRYTRATRFVRLKPSDDGLACLSTALHMGEGLLEDDARPSDPMMPLYLASDKRLKVQRLQAGRALWRSSHVFLNSRESTEAIPAKALSQTARLVNMGYLDEETPVGLRILGVAGNAQGPETEFWRDETLPFNLSVIRDDRRFQSLKSAVETAEEGASRLRARLTRFASNYLRGVVADPKTEDVKRLVDEIAPDLRQYWSAISPAGERLGLHVPDPEQWEKTVREAANQAYRQAIEALPPTARRLRAQFERSPTTNEQPVT